MGRFELASDFVINDTLKQYVDTNFRIAAPGAPLHICPDTGKMTYPKILTTGSGAAVQEPVIFAKLISMTGLERPNVVYIGTPFFDRDDKYDVGTSAFRKQGCKIKRLMVAKECTTPSPEEMRRIIIEWADLIVVSGGNSLFAMLRWQSIGLDVLIKEAALNGTVMCGGSAGCGCWYDSMQTDSLKPEACKYAEKVLEGLSAEERLNWSFVRISCMGFINAFCVPHIDTVGTNNIARVDIAKKMMLEHFDPNSPSPIFGLGLDEKAAVVYEEGKITIMSAGLRFSGIGEATGHILFVNERNEVMCIPTPHNTGEALPLEEIIERAVRSVEAVQSPLGLMVDHEVIASCHRRGSTYNTDMIAAIDDAGVASVTAVVATMGVTELSQSVLTPQIHDSLEQEANPSAKKEEEGVNLSEYPPGKFLVRTPSLIARTRSESIDELLASTENFHINLPPLAPLIEGQLLVEPSLAQ